jgi:hypothetical protein
VVKLFFTKWNAPTPKLLWVGKIEDSRVCKGKRNLNINFDDELTPSQQKNINS